MAGSLGVSQSAYSRLESGDTTMNVWQLRLCATTLGLTVSQLMAKVDVVARQLEGQGIQIVAERRTNPAAALIGTSHPGRVPRRLTPARSRLRVHAGRLEMDDDEQKHAMTYQEREQVKQFARRGQNLEQMLIMISHWMSCGHDVTFSGYAANWAAANTSGDVAAIRRQWPLNGPRMIADDRTEWGSAIRTA